MSRFAWHVNWQLTGYQVISRSWQSMFFVHGFAKNEKDNITKKELEGLRALATDYLSRTSNELDHLVRVQELKEILDEQETGKT